MELVTKGIVLSVRSFDNKDKQVDIFSEELGKLRARVISGAKMKSKLSTHLDQMNLSSIRLVRKHRFTVTDALLEDRFDSIREDPFKMHKALNIMYSINHLLPELVTEESFYKELVNALREEELKINKFLKMLGYNPLLASCFKCDDEKVKEFFPEDQIFICGQCGQNIPNEKTVKLDNE